LRQPELQNPAEPRQGPVETNVPLGAEKRSEAPGGNIGERRQP